MKSSRKPGVVIWFDDHPEDVEKYSDKLPRLGFDLRLAQTFPELDNELAKLIAEREKTGKDTYYDLLIFDIMIDSVRSLEGRYSELKELHIEGYTAGILYFAYVLLPRLRPGYSYHALASADFVVCSIRNLTPTDETFVNIVKKEAGLLDKKIEVYEKPNFNKLINKLENLYREPDPMQSSGT